MARNRIYLRCKACGATMFLGKDFGTGYYYGEYDDQEPLVKLLNKFYDDHAYCDDFDEPDHFDIIYEGPPVRNYINTNLYDIEETHPNANVQIWRNSVTGETSVGWWDNEEEDNGDT